MILNPQNVCACGAPKGGKSVTCVTCMPNNYPKRPAGRPATHTDEAILDAIESGASTLDQLLSTLNLKSKTTLRVRLDRMAESGLVTVTKRARRDGFTITSNRTEG